VKLARRQVAQKDLPRVPSATQGRFLMEQPISVQIAPRDNILALALQVASTASRASTARTRPAPAVQTAAGTHTLTLGREAVFSAGGCTITLHSRRIQIDACCALKELLAREMVVQN